MQDKQDIFFHHIREQLSLLDFSSERPDWDMFVKYWAENAWEHEVENKLSTHHTATPTEAWAAFEALGELPEATDLVLQQKFDPSFAPNIQAEDLDAGWAVIAAALEGPLDTQLVEKLGPASVSDKGDWPHMEDQLSQPVEHTIRHKLEAYAVAENPRAWKQFRPVLDKAMPLPASPSSHRVGLILLALLAFLTVAGAWFIRSQTGTTTEETHTYDAGVDTDNRAESHISFSEEEESANQPNQAVPFVEIESPTSPPSPARAENTKSAPVQAAVHAAKPKKSSDIPKQGLATQAPSQAENQLSPAASTVSSSDNVHSHISQTTLTSRSHTPPMMQVDMVVTPVVHTLTPSVPQVTLPPSHTFALQRTALLPRAALGLTWGSSMARSRLSDPGLPGHHGGFTMQLPIVNRFSFIVGLERGFHQIDREILHIKAELLPSGGARASDPELWTSLLQAEYRLWETPILLAYEVGPEHSPWKLQLQGGLVGLMIQDVHYTHFDPQSPANAGNMFQALTELTPTTEMNRGGAYWGNIRLAAGLGYAVGRLRLNCVPYFQFGAQRLGNWQLNMHRQGVQFQAVWQLGQ